LEQFSDLWRQARYAMGIGAADYRKRWFSCRMLQPQIDEIQLDHAYQHVGESAENFRWIAPAPIRGKAHNVYQVTDTSLKLFSLGPRWFHHTHARC
jgi:hypothetical protein